MDAQDGRVLETLAVEGHAENTVVILWGDHGWHLGTTACGASTRTTRQATLAALVLRFSGQKAPGKATDALVESVDIYPTLVDLCGLPKADGVEGHSFAPLLDEPKKPWKPAAFSQYPRGGPGVGPLMGSSVRTDRYRHVEWRKRDGAAVVARELYDHQTDPDEDTNVVELPAHKAAVARLSKLLEAGWKENIPPS